MSAAENLARWREAEQGATEGPWEWGGDMLVWPKPGVLGDPIFSAPIGGTNAGEDAEFIATSREAMPALLAFAEAVLAMHAPMPSRANYQRQVCSTCERYGQQVAYPCPTVHLAEQHLGVKS